MQNSWGANKLQSLERVCSGIEWFRLEEQKKNQSFSTKTLKMADFYGTVQRRLSIDGRVFQIGVDVGGLEFHDDGAKAVVATDDGDTGFANPVAVVEQVAARTMGERKHILVNRLPSLVAESLRLGIVCHEYVALLHHWASLDADGTILPRQLLVERRLENCDFNFLHRQYVMSFEL